MSFYKTLLLAVDLSDAGIPMATKTRQLADFFQAKLHLVHAIEPIPAYGYPWMVDLESPYIEQAKKALKQLAQSIQVPDEAQHIVFGSTKQEVNQLAQSLKCDLIVVGRHGLHGIEHLLGSTASGIVNTAPCDVMTLSVTSE